MTVLSGVGAVHVSIPKKLYEFARGDNITIPCTFKPKGPPKYVIISWSVEAAAVGAKEVRYYNVFMCVHEYVSLLSYKKSFPPYFTVPLMLLFS